MIEVIVPAAAWDSDRVPLREWVLGWWQSRGYRTTVAMLDDKPWRKGAAVNPAIAASDADVIVIADADSWAPTRQIDRMIRYASDPGRWVAPFDMVRRLDAASSAEVLALDPATVETPPATRLDRKPHTVLPGGGIIAAHRDTWDLVGGFDPRFADWGGEDYSLGCALRTMTNRAATTIPGTLWHLWHTPQPEETSHTSALALRYRKAKFRPDDMTALLAEWR